MTSVDLESLRDTLEKRAEEGKSFVSCASLEREMDHSRKELGRALGMLHDQDELELVNNATRRARYRIDEVGQ